MRAALLCLCPMVATLEARPATAPAPVCDGRPTAVDTVDVPLGSPLVSGERMTAFTTHVYVSRAGAADVQQQSTNTISFADSGGARLVRVLSVTHASTPNGPMDFTTNFTFDRRSLALREMRSTSPRGEMRLRAQEGGVEVSMPTPAGPSSAQVALAQPGFYGPWSDFVVEELPHKLGTTYRLHLWQPGPPGPSGPSLKEETHLYTFTGREDVEVRGTKHARAWVVEDHAPDGKLLGTMWVVDGPPKLVRWTIRRDDGGTMQIDQELVREP
jgi:hypothetical protein